MSKSSDSCSENFCFDKRWNAKYSPWHENITFPFGIETWFGEMVEANISASDDTNFCYVGILHLKLTNTKSTSYTEVVKDSIDSQHMNARDLFLSLDLQIQVILWQVP